jgi:acetylornithine deacetylase/succinyl-diaminopimelate desuccinylase-like protein
VVYGPGDIAHAHAVDEHVSLDEVATTARVFEAAVRILLR